MSSESTSSPYPLYNPAMAVSDVIPIISAPGGSTGGSGSGGSSRSMPSVVSSVVGAIVIIMVVVLVIWCVRKRRKKRRQRQESAQLGDGSMPPTPASLARGGMIYLDRSYSSQSSLSAHTQLPATPRSLLAETSEIPRAHFADSSTTHRQFPSNDVARTQPAVRVVPPVPPPPRLPPRGRADTFGDNPPDELPPYVDPIEEAMTAAASSAAESMAAADLPSAHQPGPPPYHTVDVSVLAEPRP
ncbi:hypothetical protein GGI02_003990 [Coemansia sp. RSA 2322]|nr:hypothetical protein GGI02_003990 [Coemansia sp. RSA 2322]